MHSKTKRKMKYTLLWVLVLASILTGCGNQTSGGTTLKRPKKMEFPEYAKATADGYKVADDGGLVYNPISAEAKKTGTLNKYDGAQTRKAILKGTDMDAEFTIPVTMTPYDAVPIQYKITKKGNISFPLTVQATAFEEPGRSVGAYDLAIPGETSIDIDYLGSVTGTIKDGARHIMKADNTDTPADAYPNYTTTELSSSGQVKSGDLVWLKFKYTNDGNTILDAEGTGGFVIEPRLLKKQIDGSYTDIGGLFDQYYRELTYVYPGESREFWLNFTVSTSGETPQNLGLTSGDYRVNFKTYYRTEYDYQPLTTMWSGYPMQESNYDFTVADQPANVQAQNVQMISAPGKVIKNSTSWLHYFEEFMTTYEQYRKDPGTDVITGTIYIQPASFTKQVVLKVIRGKDKAMLHAEVPVTMDTDSLSVSYNPDNVNVIEGSDGLAVPAIYAQPMTDMRVNVDVSPYPQETIVKDLLKMKDCGINLINNQGWFYLYDVTADASAVNLLNGTAERRSNIRADALKYTLDVARRLNLKMDGMGMFYFGSKTLPQIAKWVTGDIFNLSMVSPSEADYGDDNVAKAVAPVYLYQRERWGDMYWNGADGLTQYVVEDTRGYLRYEMDGRMELGDKTKEKFREWVEKKYGTIEKTNQAWGTSYKSFAEIDPEKGQEKLTPLSHMYMYNYTSNKYGFGEWSPATIDLDHFRTELRVKNYGDALELIRKTDKTAIFQMRTEGSNISVPGLDPATTNAHYRNLIYNQLRNGAVAEVLAPSDTIRSYADYVVLPLTPTEVYDVVKKSVDAGLVPMLMPQFNNMRDFAINNTYGRDFKSEYNLKSSQKGAFVKSLTALYPWWKATYDAGGVPGILWQDLGCDGVVTETQEKEMKFFKTKIEKMLADPGIQNQRKVQLNKSTIVGKYSYKTEYIDAMIQKVSGAK